MLVQQVLPAILSTPFVIQIVCSTSLETDICIPKTLLNEHNYDMKVLSEIWSQITEAPRTTISSESCSAASQGESTIQVLLTSPGPSRNDPGSFKAFLKHTCTHGHTLMTFRTYSANAFSHLNIIAMCGCWGFLKAKK